MIYHTDKEDSSLIVLPSGNEPQKNAKTKKALPLGLSLDKSLHIRASGLDFVGVTHSVFYTCLHTSIRKLDNPSCLAVSL